MRQMWERLPFILKLQACLLLAAVLATLAVSNVISPQGYQRIAFAIPAASHSNLPWQVEVEDFGTKVSRAFGVQPGTAEEFASWILEASRRQQIDPDLLASLVHTESTFRKDAVSHVGAVGPAQVRPSYWSKFCGSSNLEDPAENIYCGAQVLSHFKERCGDESCALKAYNVGMAGRRSRADSAFRYLTKIDRAREQLRGETL
ncbi:MAG: transglycosylase SLT domain-containing protein [Pseudomonadales bacterium]